MELMQILDFCAETKNIWILIGKIVRIVLIVIPIIIVLLGTFDLGKAVMAQKDDEIKNAQKLFIKKLIVAVCVFLVPTFLQIVLGVVNGSGDAGNSNACWSVIVNGK